MTVLFNNFEGTDGTTFTGAAGTGTAVTLAGTSTITLTYDQLVIGEGTSSVQVGAVAAGQTRVLQLPTSEAPAQSMCEVLFYLPALPTGGVLRVVGLGTSGSALAGVDINTDGTIQISTSGGAAVGAKSTAKLVAGKWYRAGVAAKIGTATNSLVSGYVANAYESAAIHSASTTANDTSAKTVTSGQAGQIVAAGGIAAGLRIDMLRFETGTTTFKQNALASQPATNDPGVGLARVQFTTQKVVNGLRGRLDGHDSSIASNTNAIAAKLTAPTTGSGQMLWNQTTKVWEAPATQSSVTSNVLLWTGTAWPARPDTDPTHVYVWRDTTNPSTSTQPTAWLGNDSWERYEATTSTGTTTATTTELLTTAEQDFKADWYGTGGTATVDQTAGTATVTLDTDFVQFMTYDGAAYHDGPNTGIKPSTQYTLTVWPAANQTGGITLEFNAISAGTSTVYQWSAPTVPSGSAPGGMSLSVTTPADVTNLQTLIKGQASNTAAVVLDRVSIKEG